MKVQLATLHFQTSQQAVNTSDSRTVILLQQQQTTTATGDALLLQQKLAQLYHNRPVYYKQSIRNPNMH
jgi:hypothetical protein